MFRQVGRKATFSAGRLGAFFWGPPPAAIFLLFTGVGLMLVHESLAFPWFWDDYHLIRPFTGPEIARVFVGTWDLDGVETPGYRPLTVVFNHIRASLFGESVAAHRVFDVVLLAASLTLLAQVAYRLGTPRWQGAVAGVVALATANSWSDLAWITDGVHAAGSVFFAVAALSLVAFVETGQWRWLSVSFLVAAISLLIKEDLLASYPVIVGIGLMRARQRELILRRSDLITGSARMVLLYGGALVFVSIAFLMIRRAFIPAAPFEPSAQRWLRQVFWLLQPLGQPLHLEMVLLSLLLVGTLVAMAVFVLRGEPRLLALFWLASALVATAPGVIVGRPNTLSASIGFFSLFVAIVVGSFGQRSQLTAGLSLVFSVLLIGFAARSNLRAQESLHPRSTDALNAMGSVQWDMPPDAVPQPRRAYILQTFAELRIDSRRDLQSLVERAVRQGRDRPDGLGSPFVPRVRFLEPLPFFEPCERSDGSYLLRVVQVSQRSVDICLSGAHPETRELAAP